VALLTLDDIADLRAYERERDAFLDHVIAIKRRRRVAVGPIVSLVFENRDTVRFQVQELARAERMVSDTAVQAELDAYNPLIPVAGELSATMFIELTSPAALKMWLPRLIGIERCVAVQVGTDLIRAEPEHAHAALLTRDEVTSTVHYVRLTLAPEEIDAWLTEALAVVIDHPNYAYRTGLGAATRAELFGDLEGR